MTTQRATTPSAVRPGAGPFRVVEHLRRSRGAERVADLIRLYGVSPVRRAREAGAIVEVLPRTFCHPDHASAFSTRVLATSAWLGDRGAVTGVAALAWIGALEAKPRRLLVVESRHTHKPGVDWLQVRRLSIPVETVRVRGATVTDAEDSAILAWDTSPRRTRTGVMIEAVRSGSVNASAAAARLAAFPRVRGRRELVALLALLSDGVESYLEWHAARHVFVGPGFGGFERQRTLRSRGRRYVVDLFHERGAIAVELDGRKYHSDDAARRRDVERDAVLAAAGVLTIRFTYEDIMERPQWCRTHVLRALDARLRARPAPWR